MVLRPSLSSSSSFSVRVASAASFAVLGLVSACSISSPSSSGGTGTADAGPVVTERPTTTIFSKSITQVNVEIDYAPGAEPYVGALAKFGDPWGLFAATSSAIFDGKKTVSFPTTLAGMEKLSDVSAKNFSDNAILEIAAAHRTDPSSPDMASFYVVFLDGYWLDATGAVQKDKVSVSIGDTGVMAVFKPVVSTPVTNPTPPPQIAEQLALIHAFGHAVGFVGNGSPVAEGNLAHADLANAHHCTNTGCAMSFAVESAKGAYALAGKITGASSVVIGLECLGDARILDDKQARQP